MPHPSPKFASSLSVPPGTMERMRPAGASPDRKDSPVDAQLASDLLLGFIGLLSGMIASATIYVLFLAGVLSFGSDLAETFWGAGIGFGVVAVVSVLVTLVTPARPDEELSGLVRGVGRTDITADALVGDRVWYRNPLLLGLVALVLAIVLYIPFW